LSNRAVVYFEKESNISINEFINSTFEKFTEKENSYDKTKFTSIVSLFLSMGLLESVVVKSSAETPVMFGNA
jgi:hypothetical protein